jgi:hypothetical protein
MGNTLAPHEIAALLERDKNANLSVRERYPIPEQKGPIKLHDKHERCAKRRCGSPTIYTFNRIRYCVPHLIQEVNEAFNERSS